PDPDCQALAGRVLQSLDLVEVMVVEPFEQRPERRLDVAEVHYPAAVGARFAGHVHLDHERMPVQPRALVPRRHVRQPVRSLEGEGLEDVHGTPGAGGAVAGNGRPGPRRERKTPRIRGVAGLARWWLWV